MLREMTVAVALVCAPGLAWAGDKPLYQPAPAWVKPAPPIDVSKLGDADPILLVMDQQQRFEKGQVWVYADMAMRIASPQVLTQAGTIPLPWDPAKGDLTIHRIEIIRGAERIDALAGGKGLNVLQREQQLERATLNGMLTATLPVEGLRVGDVLRVSFSVSHKDPALHGHVQSVAGLLPAPMRLQFGRVRLLWPKGMDLRWRAYSKLPDIRPVTTPDGYNELLIELPITKPAELPDDAPLRFRPVTMLDATDYADWADLSRDMAMHYRTEGSIAPAGPIAAEVARIAAATADPRQRAAMALQTVQDKIRYLFKGMDNGDYVPQSPAQTWSARYGDCKAKTLLLLAMLRALGVEAEAVVVSTDLGDLLPQRLPMPGAFNHVIVHARIAGESLWLDGTGGGSRLEDLGDVPPFRHALPLREAGAGLIEMPMRPNARPITDAEVELDGRAGIHFPMPYTVRVTVRGAGAEALRVVSAQAGKEALDEGIDNIVNGFLNEPETVERSFKYDEASATAVVTASGITYPEWSKENGRYRVTLDKAVSNIGFSPDRARPAWRQIPVSSGGYSDTRVRTRIRLPGGGAGFETEGDRTLPAMLAGVALKREVKLEGGLLTADDRSTTGIAEVLPADIPATRAQLTQAKGRLLKALAPKDHPPLFRQVEAARRGKALDPILAVYANQIALKPDEATSYSDRAWFLDRIYDRKGAIADLTKAIELEPTADRYLWRSRLYSALKDDSRAMVDARAALEIDPGSATAAGRVASLLAEQGKRDEGVAMLAERADQGGDDKSSYVSGQATLLGEGGRVDEGIALLDTLIAATPGKSDLLNLRCWLKATGNLALDSALKDCTKAIELSEQSASILDSRGVVYFRLGRMEDALADFDAALEQVPDMAASLYMRGIVRKRTGAEGSEADLAAARMIWPRIDEDYGRYGIKP
jgi:tetratricopeptide (TPR) repeat protein